MFALPRSYIPELSVNVPKRSERSARSVIDVEKTAPPVTEKPANDPPKEPAADETEENTPKEPEENTPKEPEENTPKESEENTPKEPEGPSLDRWTLPQLHSSSTP